MAIIRLHTDLFYLTLWQFLGCMLNGSLMDDNLTLARTWGEGGWRPPQTVFLPGSSRYAGTTGFHILSLPMSQGGKTRWRGNAN